MWRRWTHSPTADRRLLVADADGTVVGFAHSGHTDDRDAAESCGELLGFYSHPDVWGSGVAAALMDATLDHLRSLGHRRAVVWTLADAARARRFYDTTGWTPTGRTDTWTRYPDHPVAEVEYEHEM